LFDQSSLSYSIYILYFHKFHEPPMWVNIWLPPRPKRTI